MNILDILYEIAGDSSTKAKEAIIRREENNEVLRAVFVAAYHPLISYHIRKIPEYKAGALCCGKNFSSLIWAMNCLEDLKERRFTGNAAKIYLQDILENLSNDDAVVIERIIGHDLRCGASDSIASRVWPSLVPNFPIMLAHKDISGIKYPAYAQIKSDGARCNLTLNINAAVAVSRAGRPVELHGKMDADLSRILKHGETLDGELVCFKDGNMLDRKTGNGIINKAIKETISEEEADMIHFMAWDIVDKTSTIPYKERIERLAALTLFTKFNPNGKIHLLSTSIVNSPEEAQEFFQKCLDDGEEGAMIKNIDSVWEDKRTKNMGKMKAEEQADLKVVGWYHGEKGKKFERGLGGLICETEDGLLRTNVGGGFSDDDRLAGNFDSWLNLIIEATYNEVITSKGKTTASLFLARFERIRHDKTKANLLKELK